MNFTIHFVKRATAHYFGDDDSYTVTDCGALTLDVIEDGKRVRRFYPPTGWLELLDQEP